jgi:hypothetical protein
MQDTDFDFVLTVMSRMNVNTNDFVSYLNSKLEPVVPTPPTPRAVEEVVVPRNTQRKRIVLYPYNIASESATNLKESIGNGCIKVHPDRIYQVRPNDITINWGNSRMPNWGTPHLNNPNAVAVAVNKLDTFLSFRDHETVRVPQFTTDINEARGWLNYGGKVYCRTVLTGHGGNGIVVARTPEELVNAHLYTRGIIQKAEYRVHVFRGEVIDYNKKVVMSDRTTDFNGDVRNHEGGFTFARNVEQRDDVKEQAIQAVSVLGLDFGAVDIIVNAGNNLPYVLEVNTACGIMEDGRTLETYVTAFNNYANSL